MSTVELTDSASDGVVAAVDELGVEAVAVHPDRGEEAHSLALLAKKLVSTNGQGKGAKAHLVATEKKPSPLLHF